MGDGAGGHGCTGNGIDITLQGQSVFQGFTRKLFKPTAMGFVFVGFMKGENKSFGNLRAWRNNNH